MSKDYKVVPIEKEFSEKLDFIDRVETWKETRYIVIDAETGEILDDAQGYGFKTAQKAHAAWGWKHRKQDTVKLEKEIAKYLKANKGILKRIDTASWYAFKDGEDFTYKHVEKILTDYKDCPYSAKQIYKVAMSKNLKKILKDNERDTDTTC